ncbi:HNH endonuclease [Patescibacteria group bacterium]|nr:HNH endonuclease [Patescibacteria group bacterium]
MSFKDELNKLRSGTKPPQTTGGGFSAALNKLREKKGLITTTTTTQQQKLKEERIKAYIGLGMSETRAREMVEKSGEVKITPLKTITFATGGQAKSQFWQPESFVTPRKDFTQAEYETQAKKDGLKRKDILGTLQTELDHIIPKALGGTDEEINLKTVKAKRNLLDILKRIPSNKLADEKRQAGRLAQEKAIIKLFQDGDITQGQSVKLIKELKKPKEGIISNFKKALMKISETAGKVIEPLQEKSKVLGEGTKKYVTEAIPETVKITGKPVSNFAKRLTEKKEKMEFEVGAGLTPDQKMKAGEVLTKKPFVPEAPSFKIPFINKKIEIKPATSPAGEFYKPIKELAEQITEIPEKYWDSVVELRNLLKSDQPTKSKLEEFLYSGPQMTDKEAYYKVKTIQDEIREGIAKGYNPLVVGIMAGAETAIDLSIVYGLAAKPLTQTSKNLWTKVKNIKVKPGEITKLTWDDLYSITRGVETDANKLAAFKQASGEGISWVDVIKRRGTIDVETGRPILLGDLLKSEAGFVKVPGVKPKPETPKPSAIPKDLEPLAEEARKYKSAEEFRQSVRKITKKPAIIPKIVEKPAIEPRFKGETPIEYAIGKKQVQERKIIEEAKPVVNRLDKMKLTEAEKTELFNAIDNPQKYTISEGLKVKGGDQLLNEIKTLNKTLTAEKQTRGLLEHAWNDDTYLRTILENSDGAVASAERLANMKNASSVTFREQLTGQKLGVSRLSIKNIADQARKFATADERDIWLKQFGLRTKRDVVASLGANYKLTRRITANKDFIDVMRGLAKSGDTAIKEVYDPLLVKEKKITIRDWLVKEKENVLNDLKNKKAINQETYNIIKQNEKEWFKQEAKTLAEEKELTLRDAKDYLKALFADVETATEKLKLTNKLTRRIALDKINELKAVAEIRINDYYGKIVSERGRLIDLGWRDAGDIMGAQGLRGVMLKERDFNALKEVLNKLKPSSFEDTVRALRFFQATGDLFQLPQALRGQIATTGFIKGTWNWLKEIALSSGVETKDIIRASEFIQQGRYEEFDKIFLDKLSSVVNDQQSTLTKFISRLSDKSPEWLTIIGKKITGFFKGLEKYQWQSVMIPAKTRAWMDLVEVMAKKFPQKTEREINILAGRAINDFLGGQNWEKLMARNPKAISRSHQRYANILLFAKDYLTSSLRTIGRETGGLFKKGITGVINRRATIRKIIYGLGIANIISYATTGHSTFENDDPDQWYKIQTNITDEKGNPYYLDLMGNWGQTWNILNRPISAISGKLSGPARTAIKGLSGNGITFEGFTPIPFSWQNIIQTAYYQAVEHDKYKFGVANDLQSAGITSFAEFSGLAGTYSSGKSQKATISRLLLESQTSPINAWNYLTGQNIKDIKIPNLYKELQGLTPAEEQKKLNELDDDTYKKLKDYAKDQQLTPTEKAISELGIKNGKRATVIFKKLKKFKGNPQGEQDFINRLTELKILTNAVYDQIVELQTLNE